METPPNTDNLFSQLRKLGKEDQLAIFNRFKMMLDKANNENSNVYRLTSLSGLGSDVWKSVNIDTYLKEEREW